MLDALADAGVLARSTLVGVRLYAAQIDGILAATPTAQAITPSPVLDEHEAALAKIDALLARHGITWNEADPGAT